jgi:hypothetical protein
MKAIGTSGLSLVSLYLVDDNTHGNIVIMARLSKRLVLYLPILGYKEA